MHPFLHSPFRRNRRPEAIELERKYLRRAKSAGIRIIGPNCMGIYYPARGISWEPTMSAIRADGFYFSQKRLGGRTKRSGTAEIRGLLTAKDSVTGMQLISTSVIIWNI